MYFKSPQISNEETIRLIEQYQSNKDDIEARNQIILGNLRLIFYIAHKHRRKLESSFEDFVSDGVIGMIEAINNFNTKKYKTFSTYAYWHILKKVNSNMKLGTMSIPNHRTTIFNAYEKEKAEMLKRGETPDIETIATKIGVSIKILTDTISRSREDVSFDFGSVAENEQSMRVLSADSMEEDIATKLDFAKAKSLIVNNLSQQEQDILRYRFGLDGTDPLTLQETSQNMGISTEYVRLLQNKSLTKLKKLLSKRCLH